LFLLFFFKFQFRVRAADQGKPENYAESNVVINIDRDGNPPSFVYNPPTLTNYYSTIQETRTGAILSVLATDPDNDNRVSYKYLLTLLLFILHSNKVQNQTLVYSVQIANSSEKLIQTEVILLANFENGKN